MKKRILIPILVFALLLGAIGCSAQSEKTTDQMLAPAEPAVAPMPAAAADMEEAIAENYDAGWTSVASAVDNAGGYGGHKIIKNAGLGLETRNFDNDLAYIRQKAEEMGGYVSSSNISGRKPENYNDNGRYASLSLRIPEAKMEAFLEDARGVATVTYENTGGQDITASYFDTESRLNVYTTQRERILKLLESAENMEEIIALETELSRLTYEIESLTTQLKRWDDLVNYATISIDIKELAPASPVASDDSMGTRISEGLQQTMAGMSVFFENLVVFLVAASPVLLILGVIAVVVILLARRNNKRREKAGKQYYDTPPEKKDEKSET